MDILSVPTTPATQVRGANLGDRLAALSPRRTAPPTPPVSRLIHASVGLLWILLLAAPFGLGGILAWSAGLLYVAYDTLLLLITFCLTLSLAGPRPARPSFRGRPSLAVIVAAKNEAVVLPATLKALLEQNDRPDRILIADDGSTDATADVLSEFYGLTPPALGEIDTSHPTVHWLRLVGGGKARAMNTALPLLDEDVVLTVDADTLLRPDAVAQVRAAFAAEPALVATTGILVPACANTVSGRVFEWFQTYEYIRNFLSRFAWMRLNSLLLISGAFAGFRRTAAVEVGGFDPDCLVEDYELIHRLKRFSALNRRGWTTRVLGTAQAKTEAPSTPLSFLHQRRRWFGGFLQTQYWYRDMVGNPRYGTLGLVMLPIKAIDTFQPIYGLTAFGLLCTYLIEGQLSVLLPVAGVIGTKICFDLSFQLWAVFLYRRWSQDRSASYGRAFLASLVEPFSFQLLRHVGSVWGWLVFLSGRQTWSSQQRVGALG